MTVSITETQIFTALTAILQSFGLTNSAGTAIPIIRGLVNRTAAPAAPDYAELWPLGRSRLEFNTDTYADNVFTASISGNVLTVTAISNGSVQIGATLYGANITGAPIVTGGAGGGVGTYNLSVSLTAASGTIYAGTKTMTQPQAMAVQMDIHGPSSADNATALTTQWFSQAGVDAANAQGGIIMPLYASDPRQFGFVNDQNQYEERWSIDLHFQANPAVLVTQQFADQLTATAEAVESLA